MHRYGHYAEGTGSVLKMADIDVRSILYCTCYPELTLFSERRAIAWGGCRCDWPIFSSFHCMMSVVLVVILAETPISERKFYQVLERAKQV